MKPFYLSLLFLFFLLGTTLGQAGDSILLKKDTVQNIVVQPPVTSLDKLLRENKLLNTDSAAVSFATELKQRKPQNGLFYMLAVLLLFFGILRTAYSRYSATLFRVFFNSSLRQSQLTDQLLQSKLPSLYYNLIFIFSSGFFVYLWLQKILFGKTETNWLLLATCIFVLFLVYLLKFILLQFVGWMTSNSEAANTYIFIVFLINKIIGICLLPAIVIIAFSNFSLAQNIVYAFLTIIGILFLVRYYRSYSLLQHKLGIGYIHFILFIFAMEILPIMIIYKAADVFIVKNL